MAAAKGRRKQQQQKQRKRRQRAAKTPPETVSVDRNDNEQQQPAPSTAVEAPEQSTKPVKKKTTSSRAMTALFEALSANEKKTRYYAVQKVAKWIAHPRVEHTEETMTQLWEGLFFSMWMCDKNVPQRELAAQLSSFIVAIPDMDTKFLFFRKALEVVESKWSTIDKYRMNKFYMLISKLVTTMYSLCLGNEEMTLELLKTYTTGVFRQRDVKTNYGVAMHIADALWRHLLQVCPEKDPLDVLSFVHALLQLFTSILQHHQNKVLVNRVVYAVFESLLYKCHHTVDGSVKLDDDDDKPILLVNMNVVLDDLLAAALARETPEKNRQAIYKLRTQLDEDCAEFGVELNLATVSMEPLAATADTDGMDAGSDDDEGDSEAVESGQDEAGEVSEDDDASENKLVLPEGVSEDWGSDDEDDEEDENEAEMPGSASEDGDNGDSDQGEVEVTDYVVRYKREGKKIIEEKLQVKVKKAKTKGLLKKSPREASVAKGSPQGGRRKGRQNQHTPDTPSTPVSARSTTPKTPQSGVNWGKRAVLTYHKHHSPSVTGDISRRLRERQGKQKQQRVSAKKSEHSAVVSGTTGTKPKKEAAKGRTLSKGNGISSTSSNKKKGSSQAKSTLLGKKTLNKPKEIGNQKKTKKKTQLAKKNKATKAKKE